MDITVCDSVRQHKPGWECINSLFLQENDLSCDADRHKPDEFQTYLNLHRMLTVKIVSFIFFIVFIQSHDQMHYGYTLSKNGQQASISYVRLEC